MEAKKTRALLERWYPEYPTACQHLVTSLEQIDQQLGNEYIPTDMMVEFHQALAHDLVDEMQSRTENTDLVQIKFEQLNLLMKFTWCGKTHIKLNNHFNSAYPNCKCIDTQEEHRFKPDDICLIPEEFFKHQKV